MEQKKKLLLVDDDLIKFSDIFQSSLQPYGVILDMAGDFDTALAKAKSRQFDLIIVDIGLFGPFTGVDLVRAIRKIDTKTPIYILTAYGQEYQEEAEQSGANRYFVKPLDPAKHILKPLGLLA